MGDQRRLRFVGVDLAWSTSPRPLSTGACVLDEEGRIEQWRCLTSDSEVVELASVHRPCWMAIDASLLVPNAGGMRDVERRLRLRGVRTLPTSRAFLGRHFGGSRGEGIVAALEPMGFSLAQGDMPVFETFPRAILKAAAGARLPRYKSGAPEVRMAGCRELGARLRSRFPPLAGGMDRLLSANAHQAADMIDALACAICVHSHWRYAGQRTEVVRGDDGTHVLLPREDNVRD